MKKINIFFFTLITAFATAQTKSVLIMNGTAHIGNETVIENSLIGIKDGKIAMVVDATTAKIDKSTYSEIIDATGKHVYPGFIVANSILGLNEMEAVKASNDFREIGTILPHVRSLIAYSTDSKVIPTVRTNGVLFVQVTPRGGIISGTSSIVALNGWNWEDAAYKIDDGIHLNWPTMRAQNQGRRGGMPGVEESAQDRNKNYIRQLDELTQLFSDAKAYSASSTKDETNLRFEAMKGLFNGTKKLYIHANNVKEIVDAVNFAKKYQVQMHIVGGAESYLVTDLLKENKVGVVITGVHSLPEHADDDVDQPFKLPAMLYKAGVVYCLNNEGEKEAMGSRNIPFMAGTTAAYGLTKEQALKSITLSAAQILGIDKTAGSLEVGKDATLFISTGDALDMRGNNVEKAFIKGTSVDLNNEQQELYEKYKTKYGLK